MIDGHLGSGTRTPESTSRGKGERKARRPEVGACTTATPGRTVHRAASAGIGSIALVDDRRGSAVAAVNRDDGTDDKQSKQASR